jgi:P-type Cu2+ transporter
MNHVLDPGPTGFRICRGADPMGRTAAIPVAAPEPTASLRRAPRSCAHCGLDLGAGHREQDGPFCCQGCRTVYHLIHDAGLDRYYELRRGETAPAPQLRPDNFAWLDLQLEDPAHRVGEGVVRLRLDLQGVHCAACVWLLEQLFARRPAGRDLCINPALGTVELVWDTRLGSLRDYLAEAEGFGYRFGPAHAKPAPRSRGILVRMAVAVAAAMNVMMFSLSYYFGLAPGEQGPAYVMFGRLSFALCTVAVAFGGWPFFTAAWRGLRRRVVHLDLPIALGILLSWGGSVHAYLTAGPAAAYFDTVTIFVALMLVGRWLQEWVLERNRNSLLASGGIADLYARRLVDGRLQAVAAAELRTGDEIWVAPGDLVPVAGVPLHREALVSLDWITGESAAQVRRPGERVPAGAINAGETGFRLAAVEDFSDSQLHDLLRLDAAREADADAPRDAWHRIATVYVAAVLALATIGFLAWRGAGLQRAVAVAVSVLVVTCPCALGLAVPLARELVHVGLRRRGVLLRRSSYLEKALRVRKILFDKTGTLTRGLLALADASRREALGLPLAERRVLWNMTGRSSHPVSRCVAAALSLNDAASVHDGAARLDPAADDVREIPGEGLVWERDDAVWRFGRPAFALPDAAATGYAGRSVFSRDGAPLAALALVEEMKSDAASEVARLQAAGYEVHLLSGDAPERVQAAAAALGLDAGRARGGLSPQAKADAVRALDERDTLMVGDGLNDSPSFDAAWTAATPAVDRAVLPHKADFYYLGDGVAAVRRSLDAARRLRDVQRGNLAFSGIYNLVAVGLCLSGLVTPVVAAVLMPVSSVTVVVVTAVRLGARRSLWTSC